MYVKRASIALAVLCAAFGWSSSASANSWLIGGVAGNANISPNNSCSLPGACTGGNVQVAGTGYVDTYYAQVDASSNSPANVGFVSLQFGGNLTNVSYEWRYDNVPGSGDAANLANFGTIPSPGTQNNIAVDLTATAPPGGVYSYYELVIKYDVTSPGTGYTVGLSTTACTAGASCAPPTVPVPPAAILFVSGLAGLGLLGRKRRKVAQAA